jgi:hypothetical protein
MCTNACTLALALIQNMLDIKTTSISRPFVVTAMSEAQLLHTVERSGRIYFWCVIIIFIYHIYI